ncbi:hypothetical protein EDC04DRAFT_2597504 [Pisolithus marmoratus]|nr:hypothetical protein EDC04DRAFT_2597504 [Pisolithus marmoratus]
MSVVAVRVELPAYSQSFLVEIPAGSTILDVKQAIFTNCVGHPRPEGQRIIWRGRYLSDAERIDELWPSSDEQRIVHLSVQPSAWTTTPTLTSSSSASIIPNVNPQVTSSKRDETSSPLLTNEDFAFVRYKHWQALYILSNCRLAPPVALSDIPARRNAAKSALESRGWAWPIILDSDFPYDASTNQDCVAYDVIIVHGKPYLSLREPRGSPNDLQLRALKVLTYTFSILSPTFATPPLPTPAVPDTQPLPPEINELLQHLRLPTLRAVPNIYVDVTAQAGPAPTGPAAAARAEANLMREVPLRALLAPLLMVVLRTVLLLYFFSPTRKPLLGLCIIAWIIYEMWTHIRIVILQPLNRGGGNAAPADQARDNVPAPPPPPPPLNGQDNGNVPPGSGIPDANHARPDGERFAQGPPTSSQPNGLIDSLALMDIHNENKLLWPTQVTRAADPPTLTQKAIMFLSLGVATLHPEVYNRRRATLRQREGRLRTEMNLVERTSESTGNVEPSEDELLRRQQYREQLQTQHSRRPLWVKDYVIRVRAGDWLDE